MARERLDHLRPARFRQARSLAVADGGQQSLRRVTGGNGGGELGEFKFRGAERGGELVSARGRGFFLRRLQLRHQLVEREVHDVRLMATTMARTETVAGPVAKVVSGAWVSGSLFA